MSPVALLSAAVLLAAAQPAALQRAIELYWNGEYERAVQLLDSDLEADELVEGHKYRAFSLVALERYDLVRAEFTALLELDPGHTLDAALVSPKIVEQFELAQQKFAARLFERGKTAYYDGRYDEAYELFEKMTKTNPSSALAAEYLQLARERIEIEERTAELEPQVPERPEVDPNRVYSIGGGVVEPVAVRQDPPRYPPWDMRRGTEGDVILRLTIGRNGSVEDAEVIRSVNQRMDAEAVRAARKWQYQPARLSGTPVRVYQIVSIRFALTRR